MHDVVVLAHDLTAGLPVLNGPGHVADEGNLTADDMLVRPLLHGVHHVGDAALSVVVEDPAQGRPQGLHNLLIQIVNLPGQLGIVYSLLCFSGFPLRRLLLRLLQRFLIDLVLCLLLRKDDRFCILFLFAHQLTSLSEKQQGIQQEHRYQNPEGPLQVTEKRRHGDTIFH